MTGDQPLGAPIATPPCPLGQQTRVRLPAALDALIAAIFARIFARLEQLLALWQSGNLPLPPIRDPQSRLRATSPRPTRARTRHTCARTSTPRSPATPPTFVINSLGRPRSCRTWPHQPRHCEPLRSNPRFLPTTPAPNPVIRIRPGRAPPSSNVPKQPARGLAQPCLYYYDIKTIPPSSSSPPAPQTPPRDPTDDTPHSASYRSSKPSGWTG